MLGTRNKRRSSCDRERIIVGFFSRSVVINNRLIMLSGGSMQERYDDISVASCSRKTDTMR